MDSFKYLEITVFKNGNWYRSQIIYIIYLPFNDVDLPVSRKCKLFDTLVGSVLNFGAEIRGIHDALDIEVIHTNFLRRVLGARKTNLSALYDETDRVPLAVFRKDKIIKYWIKVITQSNSLLKKCISNS